MKEKEERKKNDGENKQIKRIKLRIQLEESAADKQTPDKWQKNRLKLQFSAFPIGNQISKDEIQKREEGTHSFDEENQDGQNLKVQYCGFFFHKTEEGLLKA